eukprot:466703_1
MNSFPNLNGQIQLITVADHQNALNNLCNRRGNNSHRNGGGGHDDTVLQRKLRNHSKYARYEPESEHMGADINGHFPTFILTVYFSEYLKEEKEEAIKLEINESWNV